jgi:hypothetical protein
MLARESTRLVIMTAPPYRAKPTAKTPPISGNKKVVQVDRYSASADLVELARPSSYQPNRVLWLTTGQKNCCRLDLRLGGLF